MKEGNVVDMENNQDIGSIARGICLVIIIMVRQIASNAIETLLMVMSKSSDCTQRCKNPIDH